MHRILLAGSFLFVAIACSKEEPAPTPAATATAAGRPAESPAAGPPPSPSPSPSPAAPSTAATPDAAVNAERAKQMETKNALKAKVAAGTASADEKKKLGALCRDLGDISCAK